MQRITRAILISLSICAPALADRYIGEVEVAADNRMVPVRVSGATAELQALAAHGRYHVVPSGYVFDIRFSPAGAGQVRVDISRGPSGSPFASEVASGTSQRSAFFAAADAAVAKTNGLGLRGFFTSKLVFIGERTGHQEVYTSDLFFGD